MSAGQLKKLGCGVAALKAAGFTAEQLKAAGFSAAELKNGGFSAAQLKAAGFSAADLRAAGYSAKELKSAGFSAAELKAAGYSAGALKSAGFSAAELKQAGFTASQLRQAGYSADALKKAGFSAKDLLQAGYTKGDLVRAGYSPEQAGYSPAVSPTGSQAITAGTGVTDQFPTQASNVNMPKIEDNSPEAQLSRMRKAQEQRMNQQQKSNEQNQMIGLMTAQANQFTGKWGVQDSQQFVQTPKPPKAAAEALAGAEGQGGKPGDAAQYDGKIKAGSILFATLVTSIDSDDANTPILARIVSGPLKGTKLMGSFSRVKKHLAITFNLMNIPTMDKSIGFKGYAIDTSTARTAISGIVDNHYLLRYGSLFASSFLEGVGSAFKSANTTVVPISVGPTTIPAVFSSPPDVTQAALIGLGQVGATLGQNMSGIISTPPTVKIPSGTGVGVLIMSDLSLPSRFVPKNNK